MEVEGAQGGGRLYELDEQPQPIWERALDLPTLLRDLRPWLLSGQIWGKPNQSIKCIDYQYISRDFHQTLLLNFACRGWESMGKEFKRIFRLDGEVSKTFLRNPSIKGGEDPQSKKLFSPIFFCKLRQLNILSLIHI